MISTRNSLFSLFPKAYEDICFRCQRETRWSSLFKYWQYSIDGWLLTGALIYFPVERRAVQGNWLIDPASTQQRLKHFMEYHQWMKKVIVFKLYFHFFIVILVNASMLCETYEQISTLNGNILLRICIILLIIVNLCIDWPV